MLGRPVRHQLCATPVVFREARRLANSPTRTHVGDAACDRVVRVRGAGALIHAALSAPRRAAVTTLVERGAVHAEEAWRWAVPLDDADSVVSYPPAVPIRAELRSWVTGHLEVPVGVGSWSEDEARSKLAALERSGVSLSAWCRQQNISPQRIYLLA